MTKEELKTDESKYIIELVIKDKLKKEAEEWFCNNLHSASEEDFIKAMGYIIGAVLGLIICLVIHYWNKENKE